MPDGSAVPASADSTRAFIRSYEDIGTDELILWPTVAELDQVTRLADVIGGARA